MTSHMPPVPPANRSKKAPGEKSEAAADAPPEQNKSQNISEQGQTANIKQNTTNAGFFKGRRVK